MRKLLTLKNMILATLVLFIPFTLTPYYISDGETFIFIDSIYSILEALILFTPFVLGLIALIYLYTNKSIKTSKILYTIFTVVITLLFIASTISTISYGDTFLIGYFIHLLMVILSIYATIQIFNVKNPIKDTAQVKTIKQQSSYYLV